MERWRSHCFERAPSFPSFFPVPPIAGVQVGLCAVVILLFHQPPALGLTHRPTDAAPLGRPLVPLLRVCVCARVRAVVCTTGHRWPELSLCVALGREAIRSLSACTFRFSVDA